MYKKILLAVEESGSVDKAIKKVIYLHKKWGCEVVMFHSMKHSISVLASIMLVSPYSVCYNYNGYNLLANYYKSKNFLRKKEEIFEEANIPVELRLIGDENPDEYIERMIEEEDFDLIVLGLKSVSSKHNPFKISTVVKKIIDNAPCDVFVIE